MDDRLFSALDDCRVRLAHGETEAQCLAAHPEHADELRPLLATMRQLRALRQEPEATYAHLARHRFHARRAAAQAARRAPSRRPLRWLRRLALPATAAAVLISSGFGLVTASADALPNSPLYKVQQAHEQVAGYLARTPEAQTAYHLRLANQRLQQLKVAHAVNAGPTVIDQLTAGMVQQTALAAQDWSTLPSAERAKLAPRVRPLLTQERAALQWEAAHEPPRVAARAAQREAQLVGAAALFLGGSATGADVATAPTPGAQHTTLSATAQPGPQATSGLGQAIGSAPPRPVVATPRPAAAAQPARRLTPAERIRRFLATHRLRQHAPAPVQTPTP